MLSRCEKPAACEQMSSEGPIEGRELEGRRPCAEGGGGGGRGSPSSSGHTRIPPGVLLFGELNPRHRGAPSGAWVPQKVVRRRRGLSMRNKVRLGVTDASWARPVLKGLFAEPQPPRAGTGMHYTNIGHLQPIFGGKVLGCTG